MTGVFIKGNLWTQKEHNVERHWEKMAIDKPQRCQEQILPTAFQGHMAFALWDKKIPLSKAT